MNGCPPVGCLVVSVFATGPKIRGLKPGRGRCILKGDKNTQRAFLRRANKAVGPFVVRLYSMLKTLRSMKEIIHKAKFSISFIIFFLFATR
jgi:hypothetical protein